MATALLLYTGGILFLLVLGQNIQTVGKYWLAETPLETAYRVCDECGLDEAEVDQVIKDIENPELTPDEKIHSFGTKLKDPSDADACEPCALAICKASDVLPTKKSSCLTPRSQDGK